MSEPTANYWALLIALSPVWIPVAGLLIYALVSTVRADMQAIDEHARILRENKRLRREIMLELIRRR